MRASDFVDFFTGCCSEVLDTMYFTTVLDATPGEELLPLHPGDFAFAMKFKGDVTGNFGLHLDYSTAYGLAANFLGEDGGEMPNTEVGDVVGELTNMLCGAVMSRVPSTRKFVLSHPEVLCCAPDLGREDALIARLETDCRHDYDLGSRRRIDRRGLVEGKPMNGPLGRKIRVLVVDDSAIVRKLLSEAISAQTDMEVIATAPDPYIARDKILALEPDVVTLDIEMPRMDGITFLKKLMVHHPIPTIIISSLGQASCAATIEALRCGAVDVLAKPAGPYSVGDLRLSLAAKIRAAAAVRLRPASKAAAARAPAQSASAHLTETHLAAAQIPPAQRLIFNPATVIALGASNRRNFSDSGYSSASSCRYARYGSHAAYTRGVLGAFAARINTLCAMEVREAAQGDVLRRGLILIAPGDYHLVLRSSPAGYTVDLTQGPPVCYQRPSVDVMFASVAKVAGHHAIGVLLTGMGTDGAKGMLALKQAGAPTIAQDEASCVVYGMPREAVRMGAVSAVASLADIPNVLIETVQQRGDAVPRAV